MDCHKIIEIIGNGSALPERTIRELCRKFTEILASESNLMYIEGPVNIIGDVHGQFYDVQKIFTLGNFIIKQEVNYRRVSTCSWETM
jgi:serine/threonine-protein phosphatase PPG1